MFIRNMSQLCNSSVISEKDYYIFDAENTKILIENGFIPLGKNDYGNYFFVKSNLLTKFLKNRKGGES